MKQVIVEAFGDVDQLKVREVPTPEPGPGEVRIRLTSVGLNYADLMARRGEYKLYSGEPPFTPGIEGGGTVDAVGEGVTDLRVGQRVTLTPDAPRREGANLGGTYRTHYLAPAHKVMPVPDGVPDEQLGAVWLTYLTAWGCLVWAQQVQPGQVVALPAASSGVALAAAQIARHRGATTIGLTTSPEKIDTLRQLDTAHFDHLVLTHEPDRTMRPWHRDLKQITDGRGVDVFFDPVAAGEYLNTEIRSLARRGCVWVYGLLGEAGVVDVTPLIRKDAAIRGWSLSAFTARGEAVWRPACEAILQGFADGTFRQHIARTFPLDQVQQAHAFMEQGKHIGKLVLRP